MKPGPKALAVALLFAGLVLVNYLASHLPVRLDATVGKIYTLSSGTRALLAKLDDPVTLDFYFSKDAAGLPIQIKNYADRVQEMLRQYVRAAKGRLVLNLVYPQPDTPEEEKAAAAGLQSIGGREGEAVYFGLVATHAEKSVALPAITTQREQLLEYDLSLLINDVRQVDAEKKKVGLISSLPLQGSSQQDSMMLMMMRQPSQPGQYVATEWARNFTLVPIAAAADKLPDGLAALAVVHPQVLSPKLLFAIDQYLLAGGKVLVAVDPASEYFRGQSGQQPALMGAQPPNTMSDFPLLFRAYGVTYNPQMVVGDLEHILPQTSRTGAMIRNPTFMMLDTSSANPESPVTSLLKSFWLLGAGSFTVTPKPGLTVTPLLETSEKGGQIPAAALQLSQPDDLSRQLVSPGKKTIAALLQGKFSTAFPNGAPKEEPAEDKKADAPPVPSPAAPAPALKESSATSTLLIIADTDWLLDDVIFNPQARQQGLLMPMNDNLDLAGNALDFLAGSDELLSIRGKGPSLQPFKVVQAMDAAARQKFNAQLTALESRLGDVQSKLSSLQAKRTDSGRLVATPEMQAEILRFQKDEAAIRGEQREIRRTLREDVDTLGRRLLWVNLLTTPLLVGVFGLWFAGRRRR
ncbi:MAG: GldG family protein [Verrucomicrobiota bacterium]